VGRDGSHGRAIGGELVIKEELHYWGTVLAAACAALIGVGVVPEPYDRIVIGLAAVASTVAALQITPPRQQP
jgi:hypothetical protein